MLNDVSPWRNLFRRNILRCIGALQNGILAMTMFVRLFRFAWWNSGFHGAPMFFDLQERARHENGCISDVSDGVDPAPGRPS